MKNRVTIILIFLCCINLNAQNAFRTACNGNLTRLDSLLADSSIHLKDDRGRSLLHWAVACKKKEVYDYLIAKGIAVNERDYQGRTPMHVAVQFNNNTYLEYLLALQPNNEWQSEYGASLMELAVMNGHQSMLAQLVSNGVNINSRNNRGSTPLEIALRLGDESNSDWLLSQGADPSMVRTFEMQGSYMGLEAPGTTPKMFAPNFISTEEQEFGSVFNKAGTEFYFGVDVGKRNEIRFTELRDGKWTTPKTIISHERYNYNDPFLSNDENRLYFISKRALDGKGKVKDVDIWYVERTANGWSEPINAGTNINTAGDEYYISFTDTGTMYFASNGHARSDTTRIDHDIYYAEVVDNEFQKPVRLDAAVNTMAYEADVFVAPDESYLVFCSTREGGMGRGDLYISFKNTEGTWTQAKNMGAAINTEHYEYCPFVTKDGKYLFYTSNQDIYWVSTEIIEELKKGDR